MGSLALDGNFKVPAESPLCEDLGKEQWLSGAVRRGALGRVGELGYGQRPKLGTWGPEESQQSYSPTLFPKFLCVGPGGFYVRLGKQSLVLGSLSVPPSLACVPTRRETPG